MARGRADQQYAPDMRFPGDQVTAPPDQRRRAASGERAYVPAQASLDDRARGPAPAGGGYAEAAGHAGTGPGGGPGRTRRGPARGYPPLPGEPGPRYPQPEFSAWNEPAVPAPRFPAGLRCPGPAWGGTGEALAERAADLADSAGDAAGWPAGLTGARPVAPHEPSYPARAGTGERGPGLAGPAAGSRHD